MIVIHTKYNIQFIKTHLLYIRINKLLKKLKKKKEMGNLKILSDILLSFFFLLNKNKNKNIIFLYICINGIYLTVYLIGKYMYISLNK